MRGRIVVAATVGLAALALSACATSTGPGGTPSASRPPFLTTTPGPVTPTPTAGTPAPNPDAAVPTARWDAILADLADRGVAATPEVVSAETVTWNDGSLGCPQPGQSYTQSLVEGMRVIVRAGDADYDYRFGRGDTPHLCTR